MKNFRVIILLAITASFIACQKQQTEEERRAEVDRQVQERLAAERQQQQAQELAQREADVRAREQALNAQQQATSTPEATSAREETVVRSEPSERELGNSSYSMFYTNLEPYGDWIETDDYGYVYRPREAEQARWRPYTNGRWVYTDAGWTWISDEPFGWATYHYGRWTRLRGVGWVWVPGNQWAPAWVSWRKGGQYVGWAPLPPEAQFDRASGIHNWSDNYYDVGPDQYVFVPTTDIGDERIERAIVPEQQNISIVNQTTNVTNITYNNTIIVNQGPNYEELRGQSRRPIQRLRLERETAVPGDNAHTVVRGEVVAMPAPVIGPAHAPERPRTVKQTIKQAAVDRGWGAVSNQREAEQARAKMKSEATAPPNAPPKKFVKPAAAPAAAAASATAAPRATATNAPVRASASPAATVRPPMPTPVHSAAPSLAPRPVTTPPPSATMRPHFTPRSATTPAATMPPAPPTPVTTPPPAATTPSHLTPLPATTPVATMPSPTPVNTPAASVRARPQVNRPPAATPRATMPLVSATPLMTAQPSHSPAGMTPPNVHHGPPRVSPSVAFSRSPQPTESTPPSSSATASATAPLGGEKHRGEKKRQFPRRERPDETTPSPSPTPP